MTDSSTGGTERSGTRESVSFIDEHPLPTDPEEAAKYHTNPTFSHDDEPPLPDELREYQQVIADNGEWRVFAVHIYGFESRTYVWNHRLGYGLRFTEESEFRSLAETMQSVSEVLAI